MVMTCLFSCHRLNAAGIAMIKEQAYHGDASAKPVVFGSMTDSGASFAVFEAAGKKTSVEKSKIVAVLHVPDAIPGRITEESELESLRKSLTEMGEFIRKFPQTEKLVASQMQALAGHIEKFESGHLRVGGTWMTKAEYAALNQKTAANENTRKEEEQNRIRQMEEEEAAQLAKGLVKFEGRWIGPEEFAKIREQRAEALKKLRAVARPLIVTADFKAAWPGGGSTQRLLQFKTGQRFGLLPAVGGGGGMKYQTLRFEDESPLTGYRDLPSIGDHVMVDLDALKGFQPATVTWDITLQPIARAEGVKKISVGYAPSKPPMPNGHPMAVAMIVKPDGTGSSKARLLSWSNIADRNPPLIEATLKSFDQIKDAMSHGVVLVDGNGTTTSPAFPPESAFPQMAELTAALSAYGQFQMSQDLVKTRIKGFEANIKSMRKQEQELGKALSSAMTKSANASARLRGTDAGTVIRARSKYEAAQSEIRVLKAQINAMKESINNDFKQMKAAEKELVEID
jgi:hypothetical protein